MSAPVTITAGEASGDKPGPAKFSSTFYTGGALNINGWDMPVVVDLAGLTRGNVLVANLDHNASQRVGNFDVVNDGKTLVALGTATAKTPAREEVIGSALEGYQWQASLEVMPSKVDEVKAGKKVEVNGQTFEGPLYVTRKGTLKGFAFVSHGADDNTTVSIAATATAHKEQEMKPEIKAWAESMGVDVDNATPEQVAIIEANYEGRDGKKTIVKAVSSSSPFEAQKIEAKRRIEIREIANQFAERHKYDLRYIEDIEKMHDHAIDAEMSPQEFRNKMYEALIPLADTVRQSSTQSPRLTNEVIEAALAQAGNLPEKDRNGRQYFSDHAMQTARDHFKGRIGLKQLFRLCAESNGYRETSDDVTADVLHACFDSRGRNNRMIRAQGFSALDISTILSNNANKFLMVGWNSVDQTCLRISKIQPVRDFKQNTVVSLTDSLKYEPIGPDGQIKHGTLSQLSYTTQAYTQAKMLAVTRVDMINDDLNALSDTPTKLGNGAIKRLNDIFWTKFLGLVGANFFASGNSNINTGVADMTVGGLDATEVIFMNQTNPDGTPVGLLPKILVVPVALHNKALTLMNSELAVNGASSYATAPGNGNPFRNRFTVETSSYISNSSYTGYTTVGWWMLANPQEMPVVVIAALNGRVEPIVDTAEADFNTLGVQMRGYNDVGVDSFEYRGGVYADGGSS